jgi:hypothetical protein
MNTESVKVAMLAEIYNSLIANNTDEKILDFADIETGWHFGEGTPFSAQAIRDAAKLHDTLLLSGFYETDAFPGLAGEVRVTAYFLNQYFEFTREAKGDWSYIFELDGEVEEERESLTLPEVQEIVKSASEKIWNTSATFQEGIGTQSASDFKVWHSAPREMGASQSWNIRVPYCKDRSANTSGNFTPMQENRQFSGFSTTRFSQIPLQSSYRQAIPMMDATEIFSALHANSQRTYFGLSAFSQMISKSVPEPIQDASALQTWLCLD